jgi:hypothetical protein
MSRRGTGAVVRRRARRPGGEVRRSCLNGAGLDLIRKRWFDNGVRFGQQRCGAWIEQQFVTLAVKGVVEAGRVMGRADYCDPGNPGGDAGPPPTAIPRTTSPAVLLVPKPLSMECLSGRLNRGPVHGGLPILFV